MLKHGTNIINASQIQTPITFSGNVTLSTGNLIVADGKGIDFSADPGAPGMQSKLFNDYEVGTWTPIDGSSANLVFTVVTGIYTKVGRLVTASCTLKYPTTTSPVSAFIKGLPFPIGNSGQEGGFITNNSSATPLLIRAQSSTVVQPVTLSGGNVNNSLLSLATIRFTLSYSI